jgi:hypothetical protein
MGDCFLWAIKKNYKKAKLFWVLIPRKTVVYILILSKHELGSILGDFFANSSGHPDADS